MKNQLFKQIVCWLMVVCMVLPFIPAADAATVSWKKIDLEIAADLMDNKVQKEGAEVSDESAMVRVSIVLEEPSTVEKGYATMGIAANDQAMAYRDRLLANQKQMEKLISARVFKGKPMDVVWNMTLVGNIISAWVPYGSLEEIASIPGVKTVAMEAQYEPAVAERNEELAPNTYLSSGMTGAGVLWNGGYTGAGSRVAIIDTGTDIYHQSLDNDAYLYALKENAAAKGMSLEEYKEYLDLMDEESIAAVLPKLHAYDRIPGLTAEDLYLNEKLSYGFNYVDYTLNISHDLDTQGEHGSHVAGISAANRFIPKNDRYVDAREAVMMLGIAPDAQLITMKVFGDSYPYDSDYMAAIEDAIILGCDAVNLSMGTNVPGSPYTDVYSGLMEMMTETDTVVVISAGNSYNWAAASTFSYLYHDDVSFDTVGSPGSYGSALTVASVNNDGDMGFFFMVGDRPFFYLETLGYGNTSMIEMDKSLDLDGTEYDYVFLDGIGEVHEYEGIDVSGKVVFVQRGTLSFGEKANNALSRGAVAVVVYNNQDGYSNMDLTGLNYTAPVVSITQAEGAAVRAASQNKGGYLTGKIIVHGKMGVGMVGSEYYTMSPFSSWGVPSSLTLKPEITAPGGEIYSLWGSNAVTGGGYNKYVTMSGTSMAAPQITGMVALMAQVYQENGLAAKSGISARHLAQSLLMSTAEPLFEEDSGGNYYSILNQGAGLARVDLASQADTFVQVLGQDDYKVKAELGDDPQRTGIYEFEFTINNLTGEAKDYALDADLFRQDVFEYTADSDIWLLDTWTIGLDANVTFYSDSMGVGSSVSHDLNGDGRTNDADADFLLEYLVGNESRLMADGDVSGDGKVDSYDAHLLLASLSGDIVTVPANGTATVRVRMELTAEAKAELDHETPKGTYVEAFVYARGVSDAEGVIGTVHSIPVLAFYGDWSDPTMYDRGTLLDLVSLTSNTAPYLYQAIGPFGNALGIDYGDGQEYYYGGNPILDDDTYLPERNAFNSLDASRITEQGFTLIRGAGDARIQITNAKTGEVYFERNLGELYPAYYNPSSGSWENTIQYAKLNWTGNDASGKPLAEGTQVHVSLTAVPHYYRQEDGGYSYEDLGEGVTMTTPITIDNTAPELLGIDVSRVENDILTVKARDNQYVAAVAMLNAAGTQMYTVASANQTEKNVDASVELDLTDVFGSKFIIAVYDYASNVTTYEVEIDLGEAYRDYFTAYDSQTNSYVSIDRMGQTNKIADTGLPVAIRAMEYVGGYVFSITDDNSFCVASDADLSYTHRICQLDADRQWLITYVNDMAYNKADGKLYCQFYSQLNYELVPYLGTIDMQSGELEVLGELPQDVNTMAIDGQGNFYSVGYNTNILYTYTLDQVTGDVRYMNTVGSMGMYYSSGLSSMAWDHNQDRLYWAYPNTLLEVDPKTAEITFMGYQSALLAGLYTRPEVNEGRFDPMDTVERVELNLTDTRVMKGASYTLEASVWPWNASDRTVTWSSSDPSIVSVSDKGRITGVSEGKCTITATSNLNPSVSATCQVEVFRMQKDLNAVIWDAEGKVWMSEFSANTIPEYTKLNDKSLEMDLASATVSQDGTIYAASLDRNGLKSNLYKLDPETFQPTLIGASTDGYVDMAPAPGQRENSLMAVYGGNVMNVDANTGDYYNWYYMFSYNLVALAYVGTEYDYNDWGFDTQVDWYFIIDRIGYVYLMGFLEQDGTFYYLEHDQLAPGGIYTKLDFEMETPYFGSAYFDGEMLYYSAYKESKDNVTLMAIDVAGGSKACYEIGTFETGVWPVAGLMELDKTELDNHIDMLFTNAQPTAVEPQPELMGLQEGKAEGTLNNAVAPLSTGNVKNDRVSVSVTVPTEAFEPTNGTLWVEYDPAALKLKDVEGWTTAFAWNQVEDGKIAIAFAEGAALAKDTVVASLDFTALTKSKTVVEIVWGEYGQEHLELVEEITVRGSYENPFTDVPEDSFYLDPVLWAVENGITNGVSETAFGPGMNCNRAQVVTFLWRAAGSPEPTVTENPFTDVEEGAFYYKAMLWAVEKGITNGMTETTFGPTVECNRAQVVTFLWRAMGKNGSSVTSDFSDVVAGEWYEAAINWAVENGITNGMGDGTFGVGSICNRAQVVTFLYRTLA